MAVTPLDIVLAASALFLIVLYVRRLQHRHDLPPGPRALPIIGNAHQMPSEYAWKVFAEWKQTYGTTVSHTKNLTDLLLY